MLLKEERYKTCEVMNDDIREHIKKHKSIYLHGAAGVGKTHLLYYLAQHYYNKGRQVYIGLMADINRKIKNQIEERRTGVYNPDLIEHLKNVYVLFLDDLGNEYVSEYTVSEILQNILDYRYINKKPTYISSNYDLQELFKLYENATNEHRAAQIISRLNTFGTYELKGKNWRL